MAVTSSSRDAVLRALSHARLFRGVDPELIERLRPHARVLKLAQGERLWARGDEAHHFYVVLRGVLELQRTANSLDSSMIALFGPGESPAVPVTLERQRCIADAFAATPALEVLQVWAEPVLAALPTNAALANALNRALLEHVRLVHAKVDVLGAGSVPRRLAAFLLDLAERFGDEREDGATFIPLALSRAQLATYVGARIETVTRACVAWEKSGLCLREKEGFVIPSLERLRAELTFDHTPGE